jgi:hypothetical protein
MANEDDRSASSSGRAPDQRELGREAYRLADMVRDGRMSREEAVRELTELCPGLTEAEYEQAFSRGLFESLW